MGATASCSVIDIMDEIRPNACDESCGEQCTGEHTERGEVWDCPACGLG